MSATTPAVGILPCHSVLTVEMALSVRRVETMQTAIRWNRPVLMVNAVRVIHKPMKAAVEISRSVLSASSPDNVLNVLLMRTVVASSRSA